MTRKEIADFVKERDEAILSMDEVKIKAYCKKYGVPIPKNKEVFWAGMHKCVLAMLNAPKEKKEASAKWLLEHGFTLEVF